MKPNRQPFLRTYPLFLFLLPVFFVLHGCTENYDLVPFSDAVLLTGIYLASSLLLLLVFRVLFKNREKAAFAAFLIMAFHFFFGAVHDGLKHLFPGSFFTKYIFVLPASLSLLVLAFLLLKKIKKPLYRAVYYLNILFLILPLLDILWLAGNMTRKEKRGETLSREFTPCDSCNKPDVYVIIADEYAGNTELKELFNFDNTLFTGQLGELGFHTIPNSASNYNFTPYSIASTLNMDYLDLQRTGKQPLLAHTYETIRHNRLLTFLQFYHYRFYNYTYFDFEGQPAQAIETFLPSKTRLITSQTFLSRLDKELSYHLITTLKWKREIRRQVYYNKKNNENLYRLTLETSGTTTKHPKLVLTHLMMPHYPYYFDKNGNEFPFEQLTEGNQDNDKNYIEYLQYSNKKILELVKSILKNSSSPPIIILMGDHGFRHFKTPQKKEYYFSNLVSVHLPNKNYASFSDSLTNVNLFRSVLNTSFYQQLPYLKDTAIIMENP